ARATVGSCTRWARSSPTTSGSAWRSTRYGGRSGNARARSWTSRTSGRGAGGTDGAHSRRRTAGLVPLHAGRGQHRVLRGVARPRRVTRLALRIVQGHLSAGPYLLRTVLR